MLAALCSLALAHSALPQLSPTLVIDLDALDGPPGIVLSGDPIALATLGEDVLVGARDAPEVYGEDGSWMLWRVPDAGGAPLAISSLPFEPRHGFELANGRAVVLSGTTSHQDPWGMLATDGTTLGSVVLGPPFGSAGWSFDMSDGPVLWRDRVWVLHDGGSAHELWCTDGTQAGTQSIASFVPGPDGGRGGLWTAGDMLFLSTRTTAPQLWMLADPDRQPILLADVGGSFGNETVDHAVGFAGALWFEGYDESGGTELWRSDGTPAGTQRFEDIAPGTDGSYPLFLAADESSLWFAAWEPQTGVELWRTDGLLSGTALVSDIVPGADDSHFLPWRAAPLPDGRLVYRSGVAVSATAGTDVEPYLSDGTVAGTSKLAELSTGSASSMPDDFATLGERVFFSASGGGLGRELWSTDATTSGTQLVSDLSPGPSSSDPEPTVLDGEILFSATTPDVGRELWRADDSPAGVSLAANLLPEPASGNSDPKGFTRVGNRVFFSATTAFTGRELFVTDGTQAGTDLVKNIWPASGWSGDPEQGMALGERLLFVARTSGDDREPWVSDGTPDGTVRLIDIQPGTTGSNPSTFRRLGEQALFIARAPQEGSPASINRLFVTEGTPESTQVLAPFVEPFPLTVAPERWGAVCAEGLVFTARGPDGLGLEPWITDGTQAGTQLLADLSPGSEWSAPTRYATVGEHVYFVEGTATAGTLYRSDGTAVGTAPVPAGALATEFLQVAEAVAFGDVLVGAATTSTAFNDLEPWRSDGTAEGTYRLADLNPGPGSSRPSEFACAGDRLYFFAEAFGESPSLWVTDGTSVGTQPVPVPAGGKFEPLKGGSGELDVQLGWSGDALLFATGTHTGSELWRHTGSLSVPTFLPELVSGPASSFASPSEVIELGGRLLVAADDPVVGRELFALDLVALGDGGAEVFGQGCAGVPLEPRIGSEGSGATGSAFAIGLTAAPPASPALLFVSVESGFGPAAAGCTLYVPQPLLIGQGTTDVFGAASWQALSPASPALAGLPFQFQWVVLAPGGPLLGQFATSDALEWVLAP